MKSELRILQKLNHPNIISFIKAFKIKGNLYLIFEYIPKTFPELLRSNFLNLHHKLEKI